MGWKEAISDDTLPTKVYMFVNYESICVDSSYRARNPMKVDSAGRDVAIYQMHKEL